MNELQDALELSLQQKRDVEDQMTEQGRALQSLQDAHTKLSSRSLSLVNETAAGASNPDAGKVVKLETRVAQLTADLVEAKDDVDRIRNAEQAQKMYVPFYFLLCMHGMFADFT